MDDIDRGILAALCANARQSYATIGAKVALSAPAVKRRIDRLYATGVIRGYAAVVDPGSVGWSTEAFVELFCNGRTTPATIVAAVKRHPEVVSAYTVTGEADALVHIRTEDVAHLERILERLRADSFVASTRSVIVLSRLVESGVVTVRPQPRGAINPVGETSTIRPRLNSAQLRNTRLQSA